jgi:hypothetical protein
MQTPTSKSIITALFALSSLNAGSQSLSVDVMFSEPSQVVTTSPNVVLFESTLHTGPFRTLTLSRDTFIIATEHRRDTLVIVAPQDFDAQLSFIMPAHSFTVEPDTNTGYLHTRGELLLCRRKFIYLPHARDYSTGTTPIVQPLRHTFRRVAR